MAERKIISVSMNEDDIAELERVKKDYITYYDFEEGYDLPDSVFMKLCIHSMSRYLRQEKKKEEEWETLLDAMKQRDPMMAEIIKRLEKGA